MLKKLIVMQLAMLVVCAQTSTVLATKNTDTGPGCGLGTIAWADYGHPKNIAPQVMMATTNGTLFNTVGISFGLSGCTNDGQVMAQHKVNAFAAIHFENLSQDMAQGGGEHLASLATLMGVPVEQQPEFFAFAQDIYATLVQEGEKSPFAVLKALNDAMADHPILAHVSTTR